MEQILKLKPVLKDYIWGGHKLETLYGRNNGGQPVSESWEVSVHPDGLTTYEGGTFADYVAAHPYALDKEGSSFPILIKYIDAAQNLSVQVHPTDDYARLVEGDNGKTEMWYVVQADEGAGIYCGFKEDITKSEFMRALKEGTVERLLNFISVKAGDCYLIPAGTVHAICAGCVIFEVQQSSNVTYRVYDYGRRDTNGKQRPLHIDKALDVICFQKFKDKTHGAGYVNIGRSKVRKLTACPYFSCRELKLDDVYEEMNMNSFTCINIISGAGQIDGRKFRSGDCYFVPRTIKFRLSGTATVILTTK